MSPLLSEMHTQFRMYDSLTDRERLPTAAASTGKPGVGDRAAFRRLCDSEKATELGLVHIMRAC